MKFNVDDFVILDNYHRQGKTVTLRVKLFDSHDEEVNGYGLIGIKLNESKIFDSLFSFEYRHLGHIELSADDISKLESKIVQSSAYKKALKSFNKK